MTIIHASNALMSASGQNAPARTLASPANLRGPNYQTNPKGRQILGFQPRPAAPATLTPGAARS